MNGGGTHTINIENATFTNNSVNGCGAIFLMDQSNAGNASAINVYGGTFTDNACLLSSTSYGSGLHRPPEVSGVRCTSTAARLPTTRP